MNEIEKPDELVMENEQYIIDMWKTSVGTTVEIYDKVDDQRVYCVIEEEDEARMREFMK